MDGTNKYKSQVRKTARKNTDKTITVQHSHINEVIKIISSKSDR